MTSAQGIDKLGFRRWYERQLIEGHVYFVTCFLSLIVFAASLEQFDSRGSLGEQFWTAAVLAGSAYVCYKSLRWYGFLLARAETLGAQSNCARCEAYGILKVVEAGHGVPEDAVAGGGDNSWIRVR